MFISQNVWLCVFNVLCFVFLASTRSHVKIGTMSVPRACSQTAMLVKHSSIVHREQVSVLIIFLSTVDVIKTMCYMQSFYKNTRRQYLVCVFKVEEKNLNLLTDQILYVISFLIF